MFRDEGVEREDNPLPSVQSPDRFLDPELASWKEADRQLIRKGMDSIDRANLDFGELLKQYWGTEVWERCQREGLTEQESEQLHAWLWIDWRRTTTSETLAEQMVAHSSLTEQQRQILSSVDASHMSVYQVVRLDPGRGVELENVLEGGKVFVYDESFSLSAEKWVLIFCRVYSAGPYHFVAGGAYAFPPREKEFIKAYLTSELEKHRQTFAGANWHEIFKVRSEVFGRLIVALHKRMDQLPSFCNSDGEPLVFCEAHFRVKNPEMFLAALRKHSNLDEKEQENGEEHEFVWVRRRKDETVALGRITLTGSKLVLDCNSKERLFKGIRLLQRAGDLELVHQEAKEGQHLLEEIMENTDAGSGSPTDESLEIPPDAHAYMQQFIEHHYEDWVDQSLPALNGQTPREAAKNTVSRRRLIDLIREMEFSSQRGRHPTYRYDWNKLRRRLGLPVE